MMDLTYTKHPESISMLYALQALREDVHWVLLARDVSCDDFALGCNVPDEVVSNITVLGPCMEHRMIYCFVRAIRVRFDQRDWQRGLVAEYVKEGLQAAKDDGCVRNDLAR